MALSKNHKSCKMEPSNYLVNGLKTDRFTVEWLSTRSTRWGPFCTRKFLHIAMWWCHLKVASPKGNNSIQQNFSPLQRKVVELLISPSLAVDSCDNTFCVCRTTAPPPKLRLFLSKHTHQMSSYNFHVCFCGFWHFLETFSAHHLPATARTN